MPNTDDSEGDTNTRADADSDEDSESDNGDTVLIEDSDSGSDIDTESDSTVAQCCPLENILWGVDCGMDHADPVFTISRCGETVESPTFRLCAIVLPECITGAQIDAAALNKLLERQDVQEAFVENEIQHYGQPYGVWYSITLQRNATAPRRIIRVGLPCDETDNCAPIPEGVDALRDLLDTIVANKEEYGLPSGNDCEYHQYNTDETN